MEERNIKPGVTLIISIICILLVGSLCFWLGKQFSHRNNDEKKNSENLSWVEKNKAMSMTWLDNDLVILTTDGREIRKTITDFEGEVRTFYYDEKIYVYSFGDDKEGSVLGYIDVNDDFKFTKIANLEKETVPESIIVLKDHAYITLSGKKYIIDYDLKENKDTKLYYFDDYFSNVGYGSFLLYCVNEQVYYLTRGTVDLDSEFGTIDLETGKKEMISNKIGYVNYIYDGKIIFNYDYYEGNSYVVQYYEYDTNTKKINKISGVHLDGGASIYDSFMIPFDGYYIYVTGENEIYKWENGQDKKLQELDINSFSVYKINENEILILEGGLCELDDCDYKQLIYNVKDNKVKSTTDYSEKYFGSVEYFK